MKISIIIPLFNEEDKLPKLLSFLKKLKGEKEVIFCDASFNDNLKNMIKDEFIYLRSEKSRAKQMNYAAMFAKFEALLFLHADSYFEDDLLIKINEVLRLNEAGCCKLAFDNCTFKYKVCAFMSNLRVSMRGIAFGDQGIFIKKELFNKLKGFKDLPIMEDYDLSLRLKEKGIKLGVAQSIITTSCRRFEKYGFMKTVFKMQIAQYKFRNNYDIAVIERYYNGKKNA